MSSAINIAAGEPPAEPQVALVRQWPSRMDFKQQIMDDVVAFLFERQLVAEADRAWLYLCFDEAIMNAMLHGNEGDPRLFIDLAVRIDDQHWIVTIADHGDGFCVDDIPDHDDPNAVLLEHGRGLRIMQEWLDDLRYFRGGSLVWMARRRADVRTPCE